MGGGEASPRGRECPVLRHHLRHRGHSGQQTKAMREGKAIGRSPATPEGPPREVGDPAAASEAPSRAAPRGPTARPRSAPPGSRLPAACPPGRTKTRWPPGPAPSGLRETPRRAAKLGPCRPLPALRRSCPEPWAARAALPRPPTAALPSARPQGAPAGARARAASRPRRRPAASGAACTGAAAGQGSLAASPRPPLSSMLASPGAPHGQKRDTAPLLPPGRLATGSPRRSQRERLDQGCPPRPSQLAPSLSPSLRGKRRAGPRTQPRAGHPAPPPGRQRAPGPISSAPPAPLLPSSEAAQLPAGERERSHGGPLPTCVRPARPSQGRPGPSLRYAPRGGSCRSPGSGAAPAAAAGPGPPLLPLAAGSSQPRAVGSFAGWNNGAPEPGREGPKGEPGWALRRSAPPPLLKSYRPPPSRCHSAQPPPPSVGWKPRA